MRTPPNPNSEAKTAICVCRTSTSRQKSAETIEAQVDRCKALVQRHGLRLLKYGPQQDGWVLDPGCTGTLLQGRNFKLLIDDLAAHRVKPDYIVVFSLSRIARVDKVSKSMVKLQQSHADAARIKATLIGCNVAVIDEEGINDPKSIGFEVKMLLANEQFKLIRESTMSGKHHWFGQHRWCKGGKAPFGYRQVFANGVDRKAGFRLEADENRVERGKIITGTATHLRQILAWVCEGGVTHAARRATAEGIPTPMHRTTDRKNKARDWSPTRWSPVSVMHITRNLEVYTGRMEYVFDGKPYSIECPPLIDLATFARVKKRLAERTLKHPRVKMLTTGYVDCACGAHVHSQTSSNATYSKCGRVRRDEKLGSLRRMPCGSMRTTAFESLLYWSMVCRLIQIRLHERSNGHSSGEFEAKARDLRDQIAKVDEQIEKLVEMRLEGLDLSIFSKRNAALNERKLALQVELDRARTEHEAHERRKANEQTLEAKITGILREFAEATPPVERQREVLREILQGQRVVVTWGPPEQRGKLKGTSQHATLSLPAFGDLPPVTVRSDRELWSQMLGGRVAGRRLIVMNDVPAALYDRLRTAPLPVELKGRHHGAATVS